MTRIKISLGKQLYVIERRVRLDSTIDSYSGGLGFKPRPGQRLFGWSFPMVLVRRGPEGIGSIVIKHQFRNRLSNLKIAVVYLSLSRKVP